ncbi:MAG TPA: RsiV family protein [Flavobacterium sp.]|nr:RsiV family protein [Flavobacterium sp.]
MKKIVLFICLSVAFISCKKEKALIFSTKNYDLKSDVNCIKENCTYIHLEIPVATGNETVSKPINDTIFGFVNSLLRFTDDPKTTSYDSLTKYFINQYEDLNKTYPSSVAWEATFKVSQKELSAQTHQIVWDYYLFTGGAHGLQAKKVYFFDIKTGKTITTKDLFLNYQGFKNYAETEFEKQLNITGTYAEAGFTFPKNTFELPENLYETKGEWILYYNPYEIAPYVQGASIVKLPKEKVSDFLNPIYFKN